MNPYLLIAILLVIAILVVFFVAKDAKKSAEKARKAQEITEFVTKLNYRTKDGMIYPVWFTKTAKDGGWTCFIVKQDKSGKPYKSYFKKERKEKMIAALKDIDSFAYGVITKK